MEASLGKGFQNQHSAFTQRNKKGGTIGMQGLLWSQAANFLTICLLRCWKAGGGRGEEFEAYFLPLLLMPEDFTDGTSKGTQERLEWTKASICKSTKQLDFCCMECWSVFSRFMASQQTTEDTNGRYSKSIASSRFQQNHKGSVASDSLVVYDGLDAHHGVHYFIRTWLFSICTLCSFWNGLFVTFFLRLFHEQYARFMATLACRFTPECHIDK